MSRSVSTVILGALLLLPAAPVPAQTPADSAEARVPTALRPGATLRWTRAGARHQGDLIAVEDGVLRLALDGDTARIAAASLDSLWVREDAGKAGAWIGFVVGATPVALTCGRELDECGLFPNAVLLMAGTTLLGWGLGKKIPRWKLRWP